MEHDLVFEECAVNNVAGLIHMYICEKMNSRLSIRPISDSTYGDSDAKENNTYFLDEFALMNHSDEKAWLNPQYSQ